MKLASKFELNARNTDVDHGLGVDTVRTDGEPCGAGVYRYKQMSSLFSFVRMSSDIIVRGSFLEVY